MRISQEWAVNHLPIYLKDLGGEPSWGYLHFSTNLKWRKIQLDFLGNYSDFEHRWALILCCRPIPIFGIPFVDWINLPFLWYLHKKRSIKRDAQTQILFCYINQECQSTRKEKNCNIFIINLDIWMRQNELSKGRIKSETIDSISSAQHKLP